MPAWKKKTYVFEELEERSESVVCTTGIVADSGNVCEKFPRGFDFLSGKANNDWPVCVNILLVVGLQKSIKVF